MRIFLIFSLLWSLATAASVLEISDEELGRLGISLLDLKKSGAATGSKGLPFNAVIDFDDKTSSTQSAGFEAIVVAIFKREGEVVKKGEVLCEISSNELSTMFFELKNTRERLKIARENEQKDKALLESGVISKREYQLSFLALNELELKLTELQNQLNRVGVRLEGSSTGKVGFPVVAGASGVLSVAPKQSGEKIEAFTPYIRITQSDNLLARIKVPLNLAKSIQKGAVVSNANGEKIGQVDAVSVVIDKLSNTILATASVRSAGLKVGEIIEIYIDDKMPKNAILIPSSSVIKDGNSYLVYQKVAGGFVPKKVKILEEREGGFVVDASGINLATPIANGRIIVLKGMSKGL